MAERSAKSNNSLSTQSKDSDPKGDVKVMCRFRPLTLKENQTSSGLSLQFQSETSVSLKNQYDDNFPLVFSFDKVFKPENSQEEVYELAALPIVQAVLQGFNGTLLTYGQTSSGKTFTMIGNDLDDGKSAGIVPRSAKSLFEHISNADSNLEFSVKVSFCEIYLEKIRDLIGGNSNLKIAEDRNRGVFIQGLTEEYVVSEGEMMKLLKNGCLNREVAFTLMNEFSSRSHCIFQVVVTETDTRDLSSKTGKLFLVDLAGSEKISKTGAEGQRLVEAKCINRSLSALGLVINSLTDGKSTHIPYRDSKLTRILQDSLGGNSQTCLIITCSPASLNEFETLSTLRFGIRAKAVKNKPKVNKDLSIPELKSLLKKANDSIALKESRIEQLEKFLAEAGHFDFLQFSEKSSNSSPSFSHLLGQKSDLQSSNDALRASLIEELELERKNLLLEKETSSNLQQALDSQVEKNAKLILENKNLSSRLINLLLTMQEIEEKLNESQEINKKNEVIIQAKTQQISCLEEIMKIQETRLLEPHKIPSEYIQNPGLFKDRFVKTEDSIRTDYTHALDESTEDQKTFDSLNMQNLSFESFEPGQKHKDSDWEGQKQALLADIKQKELLINNLKYDKRQTRFYKRELETYKQIQQKRLKQRVSNLEETVSKLSLSYQLIEKRTKGRLKNSEKFKAVQDRMKKLENLMIASSEECHKLKIIEEEKSCAEIHPRIRRGIKGGQSSDSRFSSC
jgi:kinesin family protein 5